MQRLAITLGFISGNPNTARSRLLQGAQNLNQCRFAGPFTSKTTYTDLAPASYHVIVRDQYSCTYEKMVLILDVPPLDVVINPSHVSCFGANDGSIEFVPQDAEGAVQYSIDNGANFQSN